MALKELGYQLDPKGFESTNIALDFEVILISFCSMEFTDATYFSGFSTDYLSSFDSVRDGMV